MVIADDLVVVIADDLVVTIADDLVVAIADDLVVNDVVIAYVVFAVLALSTTFAKRQSSLAWTQPLPFQLYLYIFLESTNILSPYG